MFGATSAQPKSEVAAMINEDSDWISRDAAVAYVEATLNCYREKALELVRKAVNNLKVKSRTVFVAGVARVGYCWTGSISFAWRKH